MEGSPPPQNSEQGGLIVVLSELGTEVTFVEIDVDAVSVGELLVMACHQIDESIVPTTMWLYSQTGASFSEGDMIAAGSQVVLKSTKDEKRERNVNFKFSRSVANDNNIATSQTVFISFQDAEIPIPINELNVSTVLLRTQMCSLLGLNASDYVITDLKALELATMSAGDHAKLVIRPISNYPTGKIPHGHVVVNLKGSDKTTLVPVWSVADRVSSHSVKRLAWRDLRLMHTAIERYSLYDAKTKGQKDYFMAGDVAELEHIPKVGKKLQPVRVSIRKGDSNFETSAIFIDVSDEVTKSMKASKLLEQARAKLGLAPSGHLVGDLANDVRVVLIHRDAVVDANREIMPGTLCVLRVYNDDKNDTFRIDADF